jgi:hypothetical protein
MAMASCGVSRLNCVRDRRVHVNDGAAVTLTIILNSLPQGVLETEATFHRHITCQRSACDSRVCRIIWKMQFKMKRRVY